MDILRTRVVRQPELCPLPSLLVGFYFVLQAPPNMSNPSLCVWLRSHRSRLLAEKDGDKTKKKKKKKKRKLDGQGNISVGAGVSFGIQDVDADVNARADKKQKDAEKRWEQWDDPGETMCHPVQPDVVFHLFDGLTHTGYSHGLPRLHCLHRVAAHT